MSMSKTKEMCLAAVMAALIMVVTMVVQIPIPAVGGYVHIGDGLIFITAIIFGKKSGAWAGAVGACLADVLTGFAVWAPFSLVIKWIMGYVVGRIAENDKNRHICTRRKLFAIFVGILISAACYYAVGAIFVGSFTAAIVSIPLDLFQGGIGMVLYLIISAFFGYKNKLPDIMR